MPNPDGTHTAEEHRREILARASAYINDGVPHDDAIAFAGRDWRAEIKADGDRKIAAVEKFLGVKKRT